MHPSLDCDAVKTVELPPAESLHADMIVINGCAPTRDTLGVAIDEFRRGKVTATNLTVMNNDNCLGASGALGRALRTIREMNVPDHPVVVARSVADILSAHSNDGVSILLGTQNADPIEGDIDILETFYSAGVRIFQLTYQRRNRVGDGCGEDSDGGLSRFGRDVVAKCNDLGILIDVSHVGTATTLDAIRASRYPVAITHSNFRTLNPISRNKTDEEVRAVVDSGGLVGVTAVSRYLSPAGRERGATMNDYLDSLEFAAELVGVDHVAIGLDICEGLTPKLFERRRETFFAQFPELRAGGDFELSTYYARGLASSGDLANVTGGLLERNWCVDDIRKVMGGNLLNLLSEVIH